MAEAVFRHLKDRIRNGELQPGDALPSERELQAELGVSRISLREGLARLSALGLVEVSHGKGTVVSRAVSLQSVEDALLPLSLSGEERSIEELYGARALIESELAGLAAERCSVECVEALFQNIAEAADCIDSAESFSQMDAAFHRIIASGAQNRYLETMREAISGSVDELVKLHSASLEQRQATLRRHEVIANAIKERDGGAARLLARKHLSDSKSSQ